MVVQRLQSLFLLIATILLAVSAFFPIYWLNDGAASWGANNDWTMLTLTVLSALISFISIFMFKNFRRQKLAIKVAALLSVAIAIVATVYYFNNRAEVSSLAGTFELVPVAFIMQIWALRRVKHDESLLRSADRIR